MRKYDNAWSTRHPWREVTGHEYWTPTNGPHRNCSLTLKLECGHEMHRKASEGIPKKTRCSACPEIQVRAR
jgi:hypothetical protein